MPAEDFGCQVCSANALESIPRFADFHRVTSDCLPFPKGGKLTICRTCGAIQKLPNAEWKQEISAIYGNYAAYHQGSGDEQIVFDPRRGAIRRRSEVLVEQVESHLRLPQSGRLLDVGCGSGVTLRAFSARFPSWQLHGLEYDERNLPRLSAIPGFRKLHTGAPEALSGEFDLVMLVHSLEHFPSPANVLDRLRANIGADGHILVEVCNAAANPFDLLIADHLMHFTPETLTLMMSRSGYEVTLTSSEWVTKEISLLATVARDGSEQACSSDVPAAVSDLNRRISWLSSVLKSAATAGEEAKRFGLFGTSVAATWLCGALGDRVEFFVDEDPSRRGKKHLERPILAPGDVPADSCVFMGMVPATARAIKNRLSVPYLLVLPPDQDPS